MYKKKKHLNDTNVIFSRNFKLTLSIYYCQEILQVVPGYKWDFLPWICYSVLPEALYDIYIFFIEFINIEGQCIQPFGGDIEIWQWKSI